MIHIYKSIMITLLLALVPFMGISAAKKKAQQQSDRQYWCSLAYKMAQPVLENIAKGELQKNMLSVSAETAVQEGEASLPHRSLPENWHLRSVPGWLSRR